jgi:RNA polymerase sigma-70 factor (ECF subfamily)
VTAASLSWPLAAWAVGASREDKAAPTDERPHGADVALAQRCARGDPEAQRSFVERYTALVYSLCRRAHLASSDAEDVSQEVFCLAFAGLHRYRGEAKLSGWLYVLTKRRIADHLRSASRRPLPSGRPGDQDFPAPAQTEPGPEAEAIHEDRTARLRAAIDRLAEPTREILIAYYLAEMAVKDIARSLRLKESTVKTYLHRGRQALRARLEAHP